jgi:hypothetical protein
MFVKECDAVCLLPGGFGTLDEGLEVLTLLQTGKREMVPVVMLDAPGGDFWQEFQRFIERQLLDRKMISPEDTSLYKLTDRVDVAVEEILQFFRVYHSMRYVKNKLVFRRSASTAATSAAYDSSLIASTAGGELKPRYAAGVSGCSRRMSRQACNENRPRWWKNTVCARLRIGRLASAMSYSQFGGAKSNTARNVRLNRNEGASARRSRAGSGPACSK